jgi:hypothetical protein
MPVVVSVDIAACTYCARLLLAKVASATLTAQPMFCSVHQRVNSK